MKRSILLIVGLAWAASCGLKEVGGGTVSEDIWTGPGAGIAAEDTGSLQNTVWYVTGFEYPEDYNWRSDQESGSVKCSLVVYANAVPMMKLPVGDAYEVSADPDMHRMIGGDLYTDFSTDSSTIVKKNGKRLFCYDAREIVIAMLPDGDDLYTLGQNRSGKGFSYRRNGEVLYRHESGVLFSASDCGSFAFSVLINTEEGPIERYHICKGGFVSQLAVREDVSKVWDVKVYQDDVIYIASLEGENTPVLVTAEGIKSLEMPNAAVMKSCRFVPDRNSVVIEGAFALSNGLLTGGLWRNGIRETVFSTGLTAFSVCPSTDGICCVLAHSKTGKKSIYRNGQIYPVPDGYTVMSTHSLSVVDGMLYVGLTSLDGGRPAVWTEEKIEPLRLLNGYISSITSHQSSQDTVRD